MSVTPYLIFGGRCEEAITFYQGAIGAQLEEMMRFSDNPDIPEGGDANCVDAGGYGPADPNMIMHSSLRIGDTLVMASDGMSQAGAEFKGISLAIDAKDEADAHRMFNALAEGGEIQMPLGKTFFSPCFGAVADRFGVSWMIVVAPQAAEAARQPATV